MATRDTEWPGASGITRRDFVKVGAAATAVAGCGLDFAYDPQKAGAYEADTTNYKVTFTTCPYCSASCGQRVVTTTASHPDGAGHVVDIYGDFESPINQGGLCAKGAGAVQLVNNPRRIGAWEGTHPVPNMDGTMDNIFAANPADPTGAHAWRREGNSNWSRVTLDSALTEIATTLVATRGALDPASYNQKNVAFFGSSHMNNESNYIYRKMIANFGSSNTEHQARI